MFILSFAGGWLMPVPKGTFIEDKGILLVPESERYMSFAVIGLWPRQDEYFFLPKLKRFEDKKGNKPERLEEELYHLNFELSRGEVLKHIPSYTVLYVAVPDPRYVAESRGGEERYFINYLKKRCGFTDKDVRDRVRFYKTPVQVEWPQDMCKVIGRASDGRVILAAGSEDRSEYVKSVKALAESYPADFVIHDMDDFVSAEGGDLDIVWGPDKKARVLAGRNRALMYYERKTGQSYESMPLTKEEVEHVRREFSDSFFGVDVMFLPETVLEKPELGCYEVFHLDMTVCTMPPENRGKPLAFIPKYQARSFDALSGEELTGDLASNAGREYDIAAKEMKNNGYKVIRLPFADHPVRSPANSPRYRDRETGKATVLLGKYPYHIQSGKGMTPQTKLMEVLAGFGDLNDGNYAGNSEEDLADILKKIEHLWMVMDEVSGMANPLTEKQKRLFEKQGYSVKVVPVYAWGAGGMHCQLLY